MERYAAGLFQGPKVWVRTPFVIPPVSVTKSWNSLSKVGRAKAGAVVKAVFRASKASFSSFPQLKSSDLPPVLVYRDLANYAKLSK